MRCNTDIPITWKRSDALSQVVLTTHISGSSIFFTWYSPYLDVNELGVDPVEIDKNRNTGRALGHAFIGFKHVGIGLFAGIPGSIAGSARVDTAELIIESIPYHVGSLQVSGHPAVNGISTCLATLCVLPVVQNLGEIVLPNLGVDSVVVVVLLG